MDFYSLVWFKSPLFTTLSADLLSLIGKNINYYRYHSNNTKIMNEKGFVTIERLAEEVDSRKTKNGTCNHFSTNTIASSLSFYK